MGKQNKRKNVRMRKALVNDQGFFYSVTMRHGHEKWGSPSDLSDLSTKVFEKALVLG
jgi:hypothetical protein